MTDPKLIADELLVLASATSHLGLTEASLQITLAAGLVLAEGENVVRVAGGGIAPLRDELPFLAADTGNVVAFRRPAR